MQHTPTPWTFDEVPTQCGRCFRIGSREIIDGHEASKGKGVRTLPAYACIYDDYGTGETVNKANASFIVTAVNSHAALVAEVEGLKRALKDSVALHEHCLAKLDSLAGDKKRTPNTFRASLAESTEGLRVIAYGLTALLTPSAKERA